MRLREVILKQSCSRGIDPYRQAFKPSDLGIIASDYGSFSDYCSIEEPCPGKWNPEVILRVVQWTARGKPHKYVLLP